MAGSAGRIGRRAFLHIEPYPTPNIVKQEIRPLLEAVAFVDELYFGGWNYSPLAGAYADRDALPRETSCWYSFLTRTTIARSALWTSFCAGSGA